VLVAPNVAKRHVIAVMIDDLAPARPQSGFTQASVVWQAPAEGGIPRYMLLFQENEPGSIGPIRSARYYFVGWAAEWKAAYVHVGGSPQALRTLRSSGRGQLVYNVDQFRYGEHWFWRVRYRYAPHNVYSTGHLLRILANSVGATSATAAPKPTWTFLPDAPLRDRPVGGHLRVTYPYNRIDYIYDRATNTYLRSVSSGQKQYDETTKKRVAPKNVVIMFVHFGPLNDSHPEKLRLEADFVGKGRAYVSTNGKTISATWLKKNVGSPTTFVDAKGRPIALTVGQTFVQVVPTGSRVVIEKGKDPPRPAVISPAGHAARPA
jgi:hypothetical protein